MLRQRVKSPAILRFVAGGETEVASMSPSIKRARGTCIDPRSPTPFRICGGRVAPLEMPVYDCASEPKMDVKYQVFISSTFSDLTLERRLVTEQVLNLGHIPVGMELFQAGDDSQWDHIRRRIAECDYYVLIVAERYGSQRGSKSYTQLEYEYALESGIPVAAFLLESGARANWPQGKVELEKRQQIERFRRLCERKLVRYWKSGEDLAAKVTTALVELMRDKPRIGWVRGNSVAAPEALAEIARLSEERRTLQAEVSALSAMDHEMRLPLDVQHRLTVLNELPASSLIIANIQSGASVLDIFRAIYRELAVGASEFELYAIIQHRLGIERNQSLDVKPILAELAAKELVDFTIYTAGQRAVAVKNYRLTEYGKRFLMYSDLWLVGAFS